MTVDPSGLSKEAKQEVQNTLKEAESRLKEIRNELKVMGFRYQDLLSQEKIVEKQLWLAKLLLGDDNGAITKPPESALVQGQYRGATIADAARDIIEEKGRMLSAREVANILVEDGRIFANISNAVASIVTSIKRHPETFFWTNVSGINHFGLTSLPIEEVNNE